MATLAAIMRREERGDTRAKTNNPGHLPRRFDKFFKCRHFLHTW